DYMFYDAPDILDTLFSLRTQNKKLLLIGNNSRVYPARVRVYRKTGAKCEVFVLEVGKKQNYACLIRPKSKLKKNEILYLDKAAQIPVFEIADLENSKLKFLFSDDIEAFLNQHGETPLPPYIKRGEAHHEGANGLNRALDTK